MTSYINPFDRLMKTVELTDLKNADFVPNSIEGWSMTNFCEYWMLVTDATCVASKRLYDRGFLPGLVRAEIESKRARVEHKKAVIGALKHKLKIYAYVNSPIVNSLMLGISITTLKTELQMLHFVRILSQYTSSISHLPEDVHNHIFTFICEPKWFNEEVEWYEDRIGKLTRRLCYILKYHR